MALQTPGLQAATTLDLLATNTASPRVNLGGQDVNNDNRLRAYHSGSTEIDGFIKFDFATIPDNAVISAMTLTLFSEFPGSGSPKVQVRRSSYDAWSRGGAGFPTVSDEILTLADNGPFPSGLHTPYLFTIDISSVDWSIDMADNVLTLVLDEVSPTNSGYAYFFGSDPVTATGLSDSVGSVIDYKPRLTVEYSIVPEPSTTLFVGLAGILFVYARRRNGGCRTSRAS